MKKTVMLIALLMLAGCSNEKEEQPITYGQTANGYKVDKLFTVDGCTMYRYQAYNPIYFTNCQGRTQYTHSCGKNCTQTEQVTTEETENNNGR